jgi:hypothetical protein
MPLMYYSNLYRNFIRLEVVNYISNSFEMKAKIPNLKEMANEYYNLTNTTHKVIEPSGYKYLPSTVDHINWKYFSKDFKAQRDYLLCELILKQVSNIEKFVSDIEAYKDQIKSEQFRRLYINNRRNVRIRLKNYWKTRNQDVHLYLDNLTFMVIDYEDYKTKIDYMITHCYKFYKNK